MFQDVSSALLLIQRKVAISNINAHVVVFFETSKNFYNCKKLPVNKQLLSLMFLQSGNLVFIVQFSK